jgi:hypothetical protein
MSGQLMVVILISVFALVWALPAFEIARNDLFLVLPELSLGRQRLVAMFTNAGFAHLISWFLFFKQSVGRTRSFVFARTIALSLVEVPQRRYMFVVEVFG